MKNFFKAIGNGISASEDYFDNRIITGKFIGDIRGIIVGLHTLTWKKVFAAMITISKSKPYQACIQQLHFVWHLLLKIPLLGVLFVILADGIVMVIHWYAEFFLIFALTFPTIILLLNLFESSTVSFFIWFLPIFFFTIYCISALYYCIDKRKKGENISLWTCFRIVFQHFASLLYAFAFHLAAILEIAIGFAILALFFSYFFDAMALPWSGSFIYWFFVIFIGLILFIGVALLSIAMQQAYFLMVFEQKKLTVAFKDGWHMLTTFPVQFIFLYFVLYVAYGFILYWAALYYLYIGITIGLYFFIQKNYLLGFLLHKRYRNQTTFVEVTNTKPSPLFAIVALFGILNYCLIGVLVTEQYPTINAQIEQARNDYFLASQLDHYTNTSYHYRIDYPKDWTQYAWKTDSVTFYNNSNGTINGGTWLNIAVTPFAASSFKLLYQSEPGLVSYETATKDITTKVSNISVQGFQGVNYTYTKAGQPYDQHQTHYLIHKGDMQYDIQFITLTNDSNELDQNLIEKVFTSFQFTQ